MVERSSFSWKVLRLFKKLKNDKRGVVMLMFALMFAAMLAFLGLLFDGGRMYFEKRRMQVAARVMPARGVEHLICAGSGRAAALSTRPARMTQR